MSNTLRGGLMADNELEPITNSQKTPELVACQMCSQVLDRYTAEEMQAHYDTHFSDAPPATAGGSISKPSLLARAKSNAVNTRDTFWYPALHKSPPHNYSPGLLSVLKRALSMSHAKGDTSRAVLCYDRTVHIARDWDGMWSCGYRNFLMVCTALMDQTMQPMYRSLLEHPLPPSIRNLQRTIEAAWRDGYDEENAADLGKLEGTSKWIGAADIYPAFISRGIPVGLVYFNFKKTPKGFAGFAAVTDWVVKYFSPTTTSKPNTVTDALRGASVVTSTDKMPLMLQCDGHSVTIVGYEVLKSGAVNLLVFNPASKPGKALRRAGLTSHNASVSKQSHVALTPPQVEVKRKSDAPPCPTSVSKRAKRDDDISEIIVISDSEDVPTVSPNKQTAAYSKLNVSNTLKFFRMERGKRGVEFQILYFTLGEPLNEAERRKEAVVTNDELLFLVDQGESLPSVRLPGVRGWIRKRAKER